MIRLIKRFHLEMSLTSTINFQVLDLDLDLDLQALGGDGDSTEVICGPIPIIRPYMNPIYPRVTHDVTCGRTDSSFSSM